MMEMIIGLLVAVMAFLGIWNRKLSGDNKALEHENAALEKSVEISLEMEVANKVAAENELFELERMETDNWRRNI